MGIKITIEEALKLYEDGMRFSINDGIVVGFGGTLNNNRKMEAAENGKGNE